MMAMHVARMARAYLHIHIGYVPASLLVWGEQWHLRTPSHVLREIGERLSLCSMGQLYK